MYECVLMTTVNIVICRLVLVFLCCALITETAPQIRRVSRRQYCALYKFIYLLTYLSNRIDVCRIVWRDRWTELGRGASEVTRGIGVTDGRHQEPPKLTKFNGNTASNCQHYYQCQRSVSHARVCVFHAALHQRSHSVIYIIRCWAGLFLGIATRHAVLICIPQQTI